MFIYGNIRDFAYFTNKLNIIFGGHFEFFIKSGVSVLFQFFERRPIHYHDYAGTWVSNFKFINCIKNYDIGPEMT